MSYGSAAYERQFYGSNWDGNVGGYGAESSWDDVAVSTTPYDTYPYSSYYYPENVTASSAGYDYEEKYTPQTSSLMKQSPTTRGSTSKYAFGSGKKDSFGHGRGIVKNELDEYGWLITPGAVRGRGLRSEGWRGKGRAGRGRGSGASGNQSSVISGQKRSFGSRNGQDEMRDFQFAPKKKKVVQKPENCAICQVVLNSEQQASQHYNGKNHLKALRKQGLSITPENTPGFTGTITFEQPKPKVTEEKSSPNSAGIDPVTKAVIDNALGKLPTKKKQEFRCDVCDLMLTSQVHADSHYSGVKHAKKVVAQQKLLNGHITKPVIEKGVSHGFVKGETLNQPTGKSPMTNVPANQGNKTAASNNKSAAKPAKPSNTTTPAASSVATTNIAKPVQTPVIPNTPSSKTGTPSSKTGTPSSKTGTPSSKTGTSIPSQEAGTSTPSQEAGKASTLPDGQSTAGMHYCSFCKVHMNSLQQKEAHDSGTKHRNNLKKAEAAQIANSVPIKVQPVDAKKLMCNDCKFGFDSTELLEEHFMSLLHQKRVQSMFKLKT